MSYYSVKSLDLETGKGINPGPSAGYGSVEPAMHGGKRRRGTRKNKRARKPSKKTKRTKRTTRSKSSSNKKSKTLKLRKKLEQCYKRVQKLRKQLSRSKTQKGGMAAIANTPIGFEMRTPGVPLSANESALANPVPYIRVHENNVDNYSHYSN